MNYYTPLNFKDESNHSHVVQSVLLDYMIINLDSYFDFLLILKYF